VNRFDLYNNEKYNINVHPFSKSNLAAPKKKQKNLMKNQKSLLC